MVAARRVSLSSDKSFYVAALQSGHTVFSGFLSTHKVLANDKHMTIAEWNTRYKHEVSV